MAKKSESREESKGKIPAKAVSGPAFPVSVPPIKINIVNTNSTATKRAIKKKPVEK